MVTHLETDMPEYKVKWALENVARNRATGGDGIPAELLKILKDDAVKVLQSICQQTENSAVTTGMEKVNFHSNPKETTSKNVQTSMQLYSFHVLVGLYSKSFNLGFSSI